MILIPTATAEAGAVRPGWENGADTVATSKPSPGTDSVLR